MGQCREKYKVWVENLIKLASLQTSFVTMDEALKVCAFFRRQRGVTTPGLCIVPSDIEKLIRNGRLDFVHMSSGTVILAVYTVGRYPIVSCSS